MPTSKWWATRRTALIALTSFAAADQVIPAVRAGAQGYLLKDVKPLDLVAAIRAVHRGEVHLHPDATRQLLQQVAEPGPQALAEALTPREMQVLEGIAGGGATRRSRPTWASRRRRSRAALRTSSPSWAWPTGRRRRCSRCVTGSCGSTPEPA